MKGGKSNPRIARGCNPNGHQQSRDRNFKKLKKPYTQNGRMEEINHKISKNSSYKLKVKNAITIAKNLYGHKI